MKFDRLIVSESSFSSDNIYDIIDSNYSVVDLLMNEGLEAEEIDDDALEAFYLTVYLGENNNGGFSQFVYNTGWDDEMNAIIAAGLAKMGAKKHLEFFERRRALVEDMSDEEAAEFFESEYFGENPTRDKLNDDDFFEIDREENLEEKIANLLRNNPRLEAMPIETMYSCIESFLGRSIKR